MAEERASKRIKTHDGASSSTPEGSEYQVFLNFRGEDTRTNFTDHLYCKLTAAGIRTFRDNEGLRTGEEIGSNLLEAIERSTISIPIFSKGYASSKWCLTELTHMVKCMKTYNGRHTVCPVFYNVTPEVVKHQTGSFEEAFLKHKDEVNECTIQEWKDALKEVAELKGWEKDKIENGHEAKLVQEIVIEVCRKLKKSNVRLNDNLVGMDHHMDEMTQLLDINGDNGVRIVGILGMGGLGKTTIAKFMYNQLCDHFQHQCSFLEDVREKVKRNRSCAKLQKQLIHDVVKRSANEIPVDIQLPFTNKKVLIVLDDVKDKSQLKEIIGSPDYFGPGSRIIVTTRNKEVFEESKGDLIYKPSGMNDDESLLHFCNYAFQSPQPSEGYGDISKQLARSAAGLPLSLRVIGSMLYEKEKPIWEETLKKLKVIPPDEVQQVLKISYDALEYEQQQIFLDIACHFIGEDQTDAMYMWDACEFFPKVGIDALVCLSLITIEKIDDEEDDLFRMSIFRMHDQLRDLGRYIVNQENRRDFGERSRLWSHQEAVDTLKNQSGTKKVQTLQIGNRWDSSGSPYRFSNDDFKEMAKLRYLDLADAHLKGDFNGLHELRWLKSRSMTVTSFIPAKLLILDLSHSDIKDRWESSIEIKAARNLKVLNLKFCSGLTKTPDFSKFRNLDRLMLLGCRNLTEIGSSVKHLTRLTYLNAEDCPRLRKLPPEFGSMTALQQVFLGRTSNSYWLDWEGISELPDSIGLLTQLQCLSLRNCKLLEKIPESFWNLKSLTELDISYTGIRKLSLEGVGKLEKLQVLNCSGCQSLPSGIGRLTSLRVLDLSHTEVDTLPDDVRNLRNLRKLKLNYSKVKKLPGVGIECLQKLEELNCCWCESLEGALPSGIGRLTSLRVLDLSWTKVDTLPDDVGNLEDLRKLNLQYSNVKKLPGVGTERLQKLEELNCVGCRSLEGALPSGIERLSSLRLLRLKDTELTGALPKDISGMSRLETLDLGSCLKLRFPTQGLKLPISLTELVLPFTKTALDSDSLRSLVNLRRLKFDGKAGCCCEPAAGVVDHHDNNNNNGGTELLPTIIDMPSNLGSLILRGYGSPKKMKSCRLLPAMKFDSSSRLDTLEIECCNDVLLSGSIDLSNCQMLRELKIEGCYEIREIADLGNSLGSSWVSIHILWCHSLEVLRNFSTLNRLKTLDIAWCPKLREIKGLEEVLTSLEELTIRGCPLLKKDELHPDLLTSESLKITFERRF